MIPLHIGQEVDFGLLWTEGALAGFQLQVKGHIRAFRQSGEVVIKLDPRCEAACLWKKDTYKVSRKMLEDHLNEIERQEKVLASAMDLATKLGPTWMECKAPTREEMKKLWKDICG